MNAAISTGQKYAGVLPVWVESVHYYTSRTGRTIAVTVRGAMDKRSNMPGESKRFYVPVAEWERNPEHAVNSVLHSCRRLLARYDGSFLVHEARERLTESQRQALQAELKTKGLDIYKDHEAQTITQHAINAAKGIKPIQEV